MSLLVFTLVYVIFLMIVAFAASTHLSVVCHHFMYLILLFQSHIFNQNFALSGPQQQNCSVSKW